MPAIQADQFLSEIPDAVLRAPSILVAGDEPYLIDRVLEALLPRLFTEAGAEAFDLDRRDAAELSAAELDALVSTMPLMGERRIVLLKNVPDIPADARDAVKRILETAPERLCLVGTGGATMRGNLYRLWEEAGVRIVCQLPRTSPRSKQIDFDFVRWLTARARADFGKRLEPGAARALAEIGERLGPLYAELEKAALYAGDADSITAADVAAVCTGGSIGTVWELCDAVGAGDAKAAFGLVSDLLADGESGYRLVPLLATHFCRLGVAVESGNGDPKAIMAALPGRSWYAMAKGLAGQARRHSPETVARAMDLLAAADLMLKSTSHGEDFVLQRHIAEMLDAA